MCINPTAVLIPEGVRSPQIMVRGPLPSCTISIVCQIEVPTSTIHRLPFCQTIVPRIFFFYLHQRIRAQGGSTSSPISTVALPCMTLSLDKSRRRGRRAPVYSPGISHFNSNHNLAKNGVRVTPQGSVTQWHGYKLTNSCNMKSNPPNLLELFPAWIPPQHYAQSFYYELVATTAHEVLSRIQQTASGFQHIFLGVGAKLSSVCMSCPSREKSNTWALEAIRAGSLDLGITPGGADCIGVNRPGKARFNQKQINTDAKATITSAQVTSLDA